MGTVHVTAIAAGVQVVPIYQAEEHSCAFARCAFFLQVEIVAGSHTHLTAPHRIRCFVTRHLFPYTDSEGVHLLGIIVRMTCSAAADGQEILYKIIELLASTIFVVLWHVLCKAIYEAPARRRSVIPDKAFEP